VYITNNIAAFLAINATESTPAMPYDFTSPTATEDQLEEPATAEGNLPGKKVGHPVSDRGARRGVKCNCID
jgi:hypothetical protein